MASQEPVPNPEAIRPPNDVLVQTDQDSGDDADVETYVDPNGSLISKRIRSKERRERPHVQAGPSKTAGQPKKPSGRPVDPSQAAGSTPVTRDELMSLLSSLRGEIKQLASKKSPAPRKEQSAKKPAQAGKQKSVRDRQPTPHPAPKEKARPQFDLTRLRFPETSTRKPIRHVQPDGSKKTFSDARQYIEERRTQQSESASPSTYHDSFRSTSVRCSQSVHETPASSQRVQSGPHVIQSAQYMAQPLYQAPVVPYIQPTLYGGQAAYGYQPMDWQLRLQHLGDQPSAFSREITEAVQPAKVKNVLVGAYDGTSNPEDHLLAYTHLMYLQGLDDVAWCRCFPATLKGIAQQWFGNLPAGCINSFKTLAFLFASNFSMNIPAKKTSLDLGNVQQGDREGLRSYVRRFNLVRIQIHGLSDEVAFTDFFKGLKDGSTFKYELVRKQIFTLQGALREAKAYIQATELCSSNKQSDHKKSDRQKESRPAQPAPKPEESKKKKQVWAIDNSDQPAQKKKKEWKPYAPRYEFHKDCCSILLEIKDRLTLEKPAAMKGIGTRTSIAISMRMLAMTRTTALVSSGSSTVWPTKDS